MGEILAFEGIDVFPMYFPLEKLGIPVFPLGYWRRMGGYCFTAIEHLESVPDFP